MDDSSQNLAAAPRRRRAGWPLAAVRKARLKLKASIDLATDGRPKPERLAFIQSRIELLADDLTAAGRLSRLLAVIAALVHHQRFGGLTQRQVQGLGDLGFALLQLSGVAPRTSKVASLHGELSVVLSQIYRQAGLHWRSAWEQAVAAHFAPAGATSEARDWSGFLAAGLGDRALRLGNTAAALAAYREAGAREPSPDRLIKVRLGQIKALRLAADLDDAASLLAATLPTAPADSAASHELAWEGLCLAFLRTGDVVPLIAAVKRGKPHYSASYVLEAWLCAFALPASPLRERLPTVRYVGRKKSGLDPRPLGQVFHCALAIERCHDASLPLPARLRELGAALAQVDRIHAVDKELLVWAAAARWLSGAGADAPLALALGRYQTLSLALTGGRDVDTLRVAADLAGDHKSVLGIAG